MKIKIVLSIIILCVASLTLQSQSHSTVDNLEVMYKLPFLHVVDSANTGIKVLPNASIVLKTSDNISKIYFKIKNSSTNDVVYEVNYNLSSSSVTDSEGIILYERNDLNVSLSSPNQIILQPYLCEVITEDNQGNLSEVFSKIQ